MQKKKVLLSLLFPLWLSCHVCFCHIWRGCFRKFGMFSYLFSFKVTKGMTKSPCVYSWKRVYTLHNYCKYTQSFQVRELSQNTSQLLWTVIYSLFSPQYPATPTARHSNTRRGTTASHDRRFVSIYQHPSWWRHTGLQEGYVTNWISKRLVWTHL